jgi:uncharacterized protein YuzE
MEFPKVEFDTDNDICYITLSQNHVYNTKRISQNIIINLDKEGFVIGLECLHVGLKIPYTKLKQEYGLTEEQENYLKAYLKW